MRFKYLVSIHIKALEDQVCEHLSIGWKLYGNLVVISTDGVLEYYQALIKDV